MRARDREEWFWIAILVIAFSIMIAQTIWPWIALLMNWASEADENPHALTYVSGEGGGN
ncbi:hypothetical protein ACETK8_11880 [Brevundimonas staleyi]|uniref:Uncharacterized protein n=1 Tax=Brevundimonas staleyi TaxID=74326 RepID=A0ABW0FT15_9CAUL